MTARRVIDGAILDGKITFWTVNFTKSKKQPHTDNTGNEWDLSLACCLAAAGSSGAAERAQYRRQREVLKAAFVFLLLYCNMCDRLLHHNQDNAVHASLSPQLSARLAHLFLPVHEPQYDTLSHSLSPTLMLSSPVCCLFLTSLSYPQPW